MPAGRKTSGLSAGQSNVATLSARAYGRGGTVVPMFQPQHTIAEHHQLHNWLDSGSVMGQREYACETDGKGCSYVEHKAVDSATQHYHGEVVRGPSLGELEQLSAAVRSWQSGRHQSSTTRAAQRPCTESVWDNSEHSVCEEPHVASNGCRGTTQATCSAPPSPPQQMLPQPQHGRADSTVWRSPTAAAARCEPVVHFKSLPFNVSNRCSTPHSTGKQHSAEPPPEYALPIPPPPPPPPRPPALVRNEPIVSQGRIPARLSTIDPIELHQQVKAFSALSLGRRARMSRALLDYALSRANCARRYEPASSLPPCPHADLTPRALASCAQVRVSRTFMHICHRYSGI